MKSIICLMLLTLFVSGCGQDTNNGTKKIGEWYVSSAIPGKGGTCIAVVNANKGLNSKIEKATLTVTRAMSQKTPYYVTVNVEGESLPNSQTEIRVGLKTSEMESTRQGFSVPLDNGERIAKAFESGGIAIVNIKPTGGANISLGFAVGEFGEAYRIMKNTCT